MENIVYVGLGGAIGAIARYLISLLPFKTDMPWQTLATNLIGAVLIGFISGLFLNRSLGQRGLLFWKTGVCGGFTTFSAFSLETWMLLEDKKYITGGLYLFMSIAFCLLGVALGRFLSRCLAHD